MDEVNEDDPLAKFRRLFLDPDAPTYASDLPEGEEEEGAEEIYEETYGADLIPKNFHPKVILLD